MKERKTEKEKIILILLHAVRDECDRFPRSSAEMRNNSRIWWLNALSRSSRSSVYHSNTLKWLYSDAEKCIMWNHAISSSNTSYFMLHGFTYYNKH